MKQEGLTMGRNAKGLEKGIKAAILFCGFFFLGCNIQKLAIVMTAEATGNAAKEVQKYDLPFIV